MSRNLLSTVNKVRARYGATCTDDECVEICNEVAWIHRADPEKWGVSLKDAGKYGTRHDGTRLCHDLVMNGVTYEGFDILVAAGGPSIPTWNSQGIIVDPARRWVAPIPPLEGPGPVPPTPPSPPPPPPVKPKAQFADELRQVNAFYAAEDGLQRPGGMVLGGQADVVAMIEWGYALMTGATVTQVLDAIRQSDEYRQKHPTR